IVRNAQFVQGCEQILVVREKVVKGTDGDVNRETSNVRRIIVGESENGVLVEKGRVVVEHGCHQPGFINHHVRGVVVNGRIEGENRADHWGIRKGKAGSSHPTSGPALNRASLL